MKKKFLTDIKNIRTAIDSNKLVVFAGAGISIDAGIPSWKSLISELKADIDVPEEESDYLKIAQMYYNERKPKEYLEKIRTVLNYKRTKHNKIHERIFDLNPQYIITTNYDDLLEQVINKLALPFSVIRTDNQLPYAENTKLLIKMHGSLENNNFVLKEDDYINYSNNYPLIESFIKSMFASKIVLFIGYSFADYNLKVILNNVRNILGNDAQQAYFLSIGDTIHPVQIEYLANKGINVINYNVTDSINNNYIEAFLKGSNTLKKDLVQKEEYLSEKGKKLLNFLTFIANYNTFNESITNDNIVDKLYKSLGRFSELKTLPPDFVANLYPFKISDGYSNNYSYATLKLENPEIERLFFNTIADHESRDTKIYEIKQKLNFCSIYYLKSENPDRVNKVHKIYIDKPSQCDCFNCRLSRLEINTVSLELNEFEVTETSIIEKDLQGAYANYQIGNFLQAFKMYDEIASKAWNTGKYFSYFIAKVNIKRLKNLLVFYEKASSSFENDLSKINLAKLLLEIPYSSDAEFKLLQYIKDDLLLQQVQKEIEKAYDATLQIYYDYMEGRRWTYGPSYPSITNEYLWSLFSFYTNNYIIIDIFQNFRQICNKGLKTYIISYATSKRYSGRLDSFDRFFFLLFVNYGITTELKKTIESHYVTLLKFDNDSLNDIINYSKNFFNSFSDSHDTLNSSQNLFFLGRRYLMEKALRMCSNIILIFSYVKLNGRESEELLESIIKSINNNNPLFINNLQFLNKFCIKNCHLFNNDRFNDFLGALKGCIGRVSSFEIIDTFSFIFKNNNLNSITDKDLIFEYRIKSSLKNLVSLYTISSDDIKSDLLLLIEKNLNSENFDTELFERASLEGIIDYKDFLNRYISKMNAEKSGNYNFEEGIMRVDNYNFINSLSFLYSLGYYELHNHINEFSNLEDYQEFFINPNKYNYEHFKPEWLLIAPDHAPFFRPYKEIPMLKNKLMEYLKKEFHPVISKIYFEYLH